MSYAGLEFDEVKGRNICKMDDLQQKIYQTKYTRSIAYAVHLKLMCITFFKPQLDSKSIIGPQVGGIQP